MHLSYLWTIIADRDDAIQVAPHLLNTVCSDLLESTGKDVQLEAAHSMLCLQVRCAVGTLVEVTGSCSSSNISQYLLPSDVANVTAVLMEKGLTNGIMNTVWVVDHVVTAMQGAYPPYSIENNKRHSKDDNLGNFLWHFGATWMINLYTTFFVKDTDLIDSPGNVAAQAYVIATANLLNLQKPNMLVGMVNTLRTYSLIESSNHCPRDWYPGKI